MLILTVSRAHDSMENVAPRRDWLMDELECLEQTLASRRAELRETEQLLLDHKAKLEAVQTEVRDNYRFVLLHFSGSLNDIHNQIGIAARFSADFRVSFYTEKLEAFRSSRDQRH